MKRQKTTEIDLRCTTNTTEKFETEKDLPETTTTTTNRYNHCRIRMNKFNQPTMNQNNINNNNFEEDDGQEFKFSLNNIKQSIVNWIKRTNLIHREEMQTSNNFNRNTNIQLARSIDHISKTVFTLVFGLFSFFYFLTYAFIKPAQLDDWIEKEFEASDW